MIVINNIINDFIIIISCIEMNWVVILDSIVIKIVINVIISLYIFLICFIIWMGILFW